MQLSRTRFLRNISSLISLATLLSAPAWCTETVIFQFDGSDGAYAESGLINDTAGNLYGTTFQGGMYNAGTVYELSYSGGKYNGTVLYSFTGGSDGGYPAASLIADSAGNLYGTTEYGGTGSCSSAASGCGVVFELVKASGYKEKVLRAFTGGTGSNGGGLPLASLARDGAGNLYGTASCGGNTMCTNGAGDGVVFELVATKAFSETVLHTFTGSDGATPIAAVLRDRYGNLYGTTAFGGTGSCSSSGCGIVFELVKSKSYSWRLIYAFSGSSDGGEPAAPLIADHSGNFYGTASCGGSALCSNGSGGNGVVFEISSVGTFQPLHTFGGSDGSEPVAGLTFDSTITTLYGTTFIGGANNLNLGVVFSMTKTGSGFTVLTSFDGSNGAYCSSPIDWVEHKGGGCPGKCQFGTTVLGGILNGLGIDFEIQ